MKSIWKFNLRFQVAIIRYYFPPIRICLGLLISRFKKISLSLPDKSTIKIIRKGNYFRFWVNQATGAIRGPLGEWENYHEPWESFIGLEVPETTSIQYFNVTTLPWLEAHNQPVIRHGPNDGFYEQQAIPGAILQFEDKYFMYFMAGNEREAGRFFQAIRWSCCQPRSNQLGSSSRTDY